jgi:predicted O-linked N-acetylglucosamine transferase (SPINDLY family)
MDRADYLGLAAAADVILDTPHYGGGANTVYDAAAVGTPTVTLPGPFQRSRWAMAVNRRLGVEELTAGSPAEYVRTAVRVAGDDDLRSDLGRRIRAAGAGLFEDARAVEELTEFFLNSISRGDTEL